MSLRQLSKDTKRQLNNLQAVGSVNSIAARVEMLFPEKSEHYTLGVVGNDIIMKTKDDKVEIAKYPANFTGLLMLVYEADLNIATALMYYAEGGV